MHMHVHTHTRARAHTHTHTYTHSHTSPRHSPLFTMSTGYIGQDLLAILPLGDSPRLAWLTLTDGGSSLCMAWIASVLCQASHTSAVVLQLSLFLPLGLHHDYILCLWEQWDGILHTCPNPGSLPWYNWSTSNFPVFSGWYIVPHSVPQVDTEGCNGDFSS